MCKFTFSLRNAVELLGLLQHLTTAAFLGLSFLLFVFSEIKNKWTGSKLT